MAEEKKAKKVKSVADMSSRELRYKRREWSTKKRTQREKQKAAQQLQDHSPPATPSHAEPHVTPTSSTQATARRKRVQRDRSKLFPQVQSLATQLAKLLKRLNDTRKDISDFYRICEDGRVLLFLQGKRQKRCC